MLFNSTFDLTSSLRFKIYENLVSCEAPGNPLIAFGPSPTILSSLTQEGTVGLSARSAIVLI